MTRSNKFSGIIHDNIFCTPGVNPAVTVGTVVTYACPFGSVFEDDWFREPKVRLVCEEDGLFDEPDPWPVCMTRKSHNI